MKQHILTHKTRDPNLPPGAADESDSRGSGGSDREAPPSPGEAAAAATAAAMAGLKRSPARDAEVMMPLPKRIHHGESSLLGLSCNLTKLNTASIKPN